MRIIPVALRFAPTHWYYPTISTIAHSLRSFTGSFAFSSHCLSLILTLGYASPLSKLVHFYIINYFNITHRLSLVLLAAPIARGDIQNLWSPSQEISNNVSYVGLSEKFKISSCLRVWGLRWYDFTSASPIMVIFKVCGRRVKSFPILYHM